jgi:HAD superfamily 5'-nucleotidase-like hydrolase
MNYSTPTMSLERKVFCNRTLNLRSIRAIGYDMDYTLVHYHVEEWEQRAYEYLKQQLAAQGWPVHNLQFDPQMVCRGLVIDTEKGNLIKTNRFGFVKHAMHGISKLDFETQRQTYSRTIVDLAEKRWVFLNTLFSLSEGCIYAQLVDLLDQRLIPEVLGYSDLYERVKTVLEAAHMEGRLKADIINNPERYIILDAETPLALLDQYYAGKKLMLITNSEWHYTVPMMNYTFNRFLPHGMTWRDLFEIVVVGARKPAFFTTYQPFFEVVDDAGNLKPNSNRLQKGTAYLGGSARELEKYLGLSGDEILYVGDHMFGDVHVTKNVLRWRTALILRELEDEIRSVQSFHQKEIELSALMERKENLEAKICQARTDLQRLQHQYGPQTASSAQDLEKLIESFRVELNRLDEITGPLAKAAAELNNPEWGLLLRAGNDKSYLAYQLERYADIYSSRVSNFLNISPFAYLRSPQGSLPHDSVLEKTSTQHLLSDKK